MKTIKIWVVLLLTVFFSDAGAQYMSTNKLSGVGLPFFRSGIFRTFTKDGEKRIIKIYIQMMNDDLTFLKEKDSFFAEVEYEIFVNDKNNKSVFNKTKTSRITTTNFEETNSRKKFNTFVSDIDIPPGDYNAIITVLDKNSNKQVNRKIKFNLEAIEGPEFLISDIMFFQNFERDSSGRITKFQPNLQNNFSGSGKYIYFYFNSVVKDPEDTLRITYKIYDSKKYINQSNEFEVVHKPAYEEYFIRINREHFDQNRYELEITGTYHKKTMSNHKLFSFFWTTSPESPKDLTLALEQMRYIPDADSIGWALKQTYEEKLAYFKRFWKRMDPNPDTKKNELMDEYYMRVNLASQTFSTLSMDGWKTDRGRIFIKFGEPEDIERYPFEIDRYPFEVWRYYSLRKVFLFEDRTGFGDFQLNPAYYDEEYN